MFTGIIEARGRISGIESVPDGLTLFVDLGNLESETIRAGDSIAVNGVCLTVTRLDGGIGRFDVSRETMDRCLVGEWKVGDGMNLESALTLAKPLGGHLVSGHVDGTGVLDAVVPGEESTWMRIRVPRNLGRYVAIKGSVAVNGVSLTSNRVTDDGVETLFELTLVPHTLSMTTLGGLAAGDGVHIEVDILARYLQRLLQSERQYEEN